MRLFKHPLYNLHQYLEVDLSDPAAPAKVTMVIPSRKLIIRLKVRNYGTDTEEIIDEEEETFKVGV